MTLTPVTICLILADICFFVDAFRAFHWRAPSPLNGPPSPLFSGIGWFSLAWALILLAYLIGHGVLASTGGV